MTPFVAAADPFPLLLLVLAVAMAAALVGRWVAGRLFQPTVLGEIGIGILIGNLGVWLGSHLALLVMHMNEVIPMLDVMLEQNVNLSTAQRFVTNGDPVRMADTQPVVDLLNGSRGTQLLELGNDMQLAANMGLVILFFAMGLRASVSELQSAGVRALRVGLAGTLVPLFSVAGLSYLLQPEAGLLAHLFLGTLFTDAGMGLPARIFGDAGLSDSPEVSIVLSAALMNQILELILIAVLTGLAMTGGEFELGPVISIIGLAVVYLGLVTVFGGRVARFLGPLFQRLDRRTGKVVFALGLAFFLSWLATLAGLVAFMGAFAAGLVLNDDQFRGEHDDPDEQGLAEMVRPVEKALVPVFFVFIGMQVDLSAFNSAWALLVALLFTVVGMLSKLVAGWSTGGGLSGTAVGLATSSRGGTILIFAGLGQLAGIFDEDLFAPLAIFVLVSTLLCGMGTQRMMPRLKARANAPA